MTWIVADTVPRYIQPRLQPVYDALEELSGGGWGLGKTGKPLSLVIQAAVASILAYLLAIWSAWCLLRCIAYAPPSGAPRVAYYLTGFVCCEYALGKIARAEQYRSFFMSVFPFTMSMGAFVVFSMNPQAMKDAYPWLLRLVGAEF